MSERRPGGQVEIRTGDATITARRQPEGGPFIEVNFP